MATRVGYRALIVDEERPAYQLGQFLMRPELNGRVIQGFVINDKLSDAFSQAEQSDFIFIDPFTFGLAESIRFIAEVQTRLPGKAFTLFRSNRQWQERQRDIEGLSLSPARLRTMLYLDKDAMGDAAFAQAIRNNIGSMEREFQQELQRSGFVDPTRAGFTDPGVPRVGTWYGAPDYNASPRQPGFYDPAATSLSGIHLNQLNGPAQLQAVIDAAVAAALRQAPTPSRTNTTPLLPPASDQAQWQQVVPQLQQNAAAMQQNVNGLQQSITALQGAQTKLQDQSAAVQRDQRDFRTAISSTEQRMHDIEARLHTAEQDNAHLRASQRLLQILLIIALVLGVAALAVTLVTTLLHK